MRIYNKRKLNLPREVILITHGLTFGHSSRYFTSYSTLVTHNVTRFHFTFRTKPSFNVKVLIRAAYHNVSDIIF